MKFSEDKETPFWAVPNVVWVKTERETDSSKSPCIAVVVPFFHPHNQAVNQSVSQSFSVFLPPALSSCIPVEFTFSLCAEHAHKNIRWFPLAKALQRTVILIQKAKKAFAITNTLPWPYLSTPSLQCSPHPWQFYHEDWGYLEASAYSIDWNAISVTKHCLSLRMLCTFSLKYPLARGHNCHAFHVH